MTPFIISYYSIVLDGWCLPGIIKKSTAWVIGLLILLAICPGFVSAQHAYYTAVIEAKIARGANDNDLAIAHYTRAFKEEQVLVRDLVSAANLAYAPIHALSMQWAKRAVDAGLDSVGIVTKFKRFAQADQAVLLACARAQQVKNPDRRALYQRLEAMDREYREDFDFSQPREVQDSINQLMQTQDSTVYQMLWQDIAANGWPGEVYVASTQLYLMLTHNIIKLDRDNRLDDVLQAVMEVKFPPYWYGSLVDRLFYINEQKQWYGTMISPDQNDDFKMKVLPVKDPEEVDSRRRSIGLEPLAVYASKMNAQCAY